ncbi:MAG: class I SAM-dependent methyltransferase [Chloroflexi bacterium]|nr:class I SAM-dependent methyltransferase [Chloroflexota bacterium]
MQRLDWAAHWRELVEQREDQARRLREQAGLPAGNFWDQRAEGFRQATQRRAGEPDRFLERVLEHLAPEHTVLDVGAGVGRYALPLAQRARHLVAVEPSQGMRSLLESDAAAQGVANLTVVPASWEEAQVEPCDMVLCSHVVYAVPDIAGFVEKLHAHTRACCFMAVRTSQIAGHLRELWLRVHREERIPEPSFMELYNVLYQRLGVVANVEVMPFRVGRGPLATFDTFEEAVAGVRGQLFLAEGDPREALVQEHLKERLVKDDEGRLVLPGRSVGAAVLWWDMRPGSWNLAPMALPER